MRRFHYQLEPAHAGKHLIRSVSIEFVDKRAKSERRGEPALIETDPLEVNVTSELEGKAPSLANLEPMTPPQPVPQTFGAAWLVAADWPASWRSRLASSWSAAASAGRSKSAARLPKRSRRPPWRSCSQRTCRVAGWSRNSICGSRASSASMLRTRQASAPRSRRPRNSCAICDHMRRFRRSDRSGSLNSWRRPTWSSTPGSSRSTVRLNWRSHGPTSSST